MLRCILKDRRSVQVSQALTISSKENSLIPGEILGNNSEKKKERLENKLHLLWKEKHVRVKDSALEHG